MQVKEVRQVADGMLAKVRAKPSMERLASNIAREQAVITATSGKITRTMRDQQPVGGTYKMRMNQFVAPHVGLRGPDSQTNAYVKPTPTEARALFSSKIVPMDDGTELLTGAKKKPMSQYGYGNVVCSSLPSAPKVQRIGFNNTLSSTSEGKISDCMMVPTYRNTAVCMDFDKGPGGASPNKMWVDGTYEETLAAIHKKQDERTKDLDLKMPTDIRRKVFNQQALVGAQVYGNELLKQNIEDEFNRERAVRAIQAARAARPGATEAELAKLGEEVLMATRAGRIERQLRLPSGSPIALQAARDELVVEQQQRIRGQQVPQTAARQAGQREAIARERQDRNARIARIRVNRQLLPPDILRQRGAGIAAEAAELATGMAGDSRLAEAMGITTVPKRITGAGRRRAQASEAEIAAAVSAQIPAASAARGGAGGPIEVSVPSAFARDLGKGAEADKLFLRSYTQR